MLLAITIRTSEQTGNACTIWERAHAVLYILIVGYYIDYTTLLDKDIINIWGIVGGNLSQYNSTSYKDNILT